MERAVPSRVLALAPPSLRQSQRGEPRPNNCRQSLMYSRCTACRRVAHRLPVNDHVWISENALAESFQRFCRPVVNHARHGSNIPGPLEARRRLAKRQMTEVTTPSPQLGGGFDLGALFNFGNREVGRFQWEPPNPTAPITNPNVELPDFMSSLTNNPPLPNTVESEAVPPIEISEEDRFITFCGHLKTITSFEELQNLWSDSVKDDDNKIRFSRAAFLALRLRKRFRFGSIMRFLEDGQLNVSNSENFGEYYAHMARSAPKYAVKMCNWDNFFNILSDRIAQGKLTRREVRMVTKNIESLTWRSWKNAELFQQRAALLRAYKAVWNGLIADGSRIADLYYRDIFRRLASGIMMLPSDLHLEKPSPNTKKEQQVRGIYEMKQRVVDVLRLHNIDIIRHLTQRQYEGFRTISLELLTRCPEQERVEWVGSITKSLVRHRLMPPTVNQANAPLLKTWLETLRGSETLKNASISHPIWKVLHTVLAHHMPPYMLSEHFRSFDSTSICKILLDYWYPHHIKMSSSDRMAHLLASIKDETRPRILAWEQATKGTSSQIRPFLIHIYQWLLRGPPAQFPIKAMMQLFYTMYGAEAVRLLLQGLKIHQKIYKHEGLWKIPSECYMPAFYDMLKNSPTKAFYLFRTVAADSKSTIRVILDLVRKARISKQDLRSILRNNDTRPLAKIFFTPMVRELFKSVDDDKKHEVSSPSEAQLFDLIALEYAADLSRSHRSAFRHVCFVYKHMQASRVPISTGVSMAMVHAGIYRALREEKWLNSRKLTWILNIVRRVEGKETAEKLDQLTFQQQSVMLQEKVQQKRLESRIRALAAQR